MTETVVRAAGGVVARDGPSGLEVLLVHRPRYDDWSHPKGKVDRGETDEAAARREVLEETGFECELGAELPSVRYLDHAGRDKVVRYWVMRPANGAFVAGDEVDEIRWRAPHEAATLLSYEHDRAVLSAALDHT